VLTAQEAAMQARVALLLPCDGADRPAFAIRILDRGYVFSLRSSARGPAW